MTTFEAYTPLNDRPVRTFNTKDLADRYAERMKVLGTDIRIVRKVESRRAA